MGRLLVSVRGPSEALAAAEGGAHISDNECTRLAHKWATQPTMPFLPGLDGECLGFER